MLAIAIAVAAASDAAAVVHSWSAVGVVVYGCWSGDAPQFLSQTREPCAWLGTWLSNKTPPASIPTNWPVDERPREDGCYYC